MELRSMETYIALLRGVNVSGRNKLSMSALKMMAEALKLAKVSTYIQSGNLVFGSPVADSKNVSRLLTQAISHQFSLQIPVMVRRKEALALALDNNPFLQKKELKSEHLYVTFLGEQPAPENVEKTVHCQYPPDQMIISGQEIYLYCPGGYGHTKFYNTFFEKKLKVSATTRNLRTLRALLELAQDNN